MLSTLEENKERTNQKKLYFLDNLITKFSFMVGNLKRFRTVGWRESFSSSEILKNKKHVTSTKACQAINVLFRFRPCLNNLGFSYKDKIPTEEFFAKKITGQMICSDWGQKKTAVVHDDSVSLCKEVYRSSSWDRQEMKYFFHCVSTASETVMCIATHSD